MPGGKATRVRPRGDDYMDKKVVLKDQEGTIIFHGTRRECLQVARKREVVRLQEAGLM
jgi:hypothetical protein